MGSPFRAPVLAPPRGFRDILPTEARELRAIEHSLSETFTSYGYVPIDPPMVEHVTGDSGPERHRLMQFLDRDGSLVALRPDITTAVARLVAQRYRDATGALRLSYFAPVFREEPAMLGAEREYDQAGVELVGPSGPLADAEVLALLAESLARCGLRDATIEVGHVGVVRRAFADLGDEAVAAVLRGEAHDAVEILATGMRRALHVSSRGAAELPLDRSDLAHSSASGFANSTVRSRR